MQTISNGFLFLILYHYWSHCILPSSMTKLFILPCKSTGNVYYPHRNLCICILLFRKQAEICSYQWCTDHSTAHLHSVCETVHRGTWWQRRTGSTCHRFQWRRHCSPPLCALPSASGPHSPVFRQDKYMHLYSLSGLNNKKCWPRNATMG